MRTKTKPVKPKPKSKRKKSGDQAKSTNGELLTIDEINTRYPDQWVLIDDPQVDKSLAVQGGRVVYHGKNRDAMHRAANRLPIPRRFAAHFTGEVPENVVYML